MAGLPGRKRCPGLVQGAEEQRFLYLAFPKFEAEWSGSLQKILTDMGLEDAFTPGQADFPGWAITPTAIT